VDLLAFMAAAYDAYADILEINERRDEGEDYRGRAEAVRAFIEIHFWDAAKQGFNTIFGTDGIYSKGGGLEPYLLYNNAVVLGEMRASLIRDMVKNSAINVEMKSYYPEILYRYGEYEKATQILLELCDPVTERRDYPEVSFAVMGSFVAGLMGIEADAREGTVATLPRLSNRTSWAEVDFVPVLGNEITVRHNRREETVFTNRSGWTLTWIARFYGEGSELLVDGKPMPAKSVSDPAGHPLLQIRIPVLPGQSCFVSSGSVMR
jgi:hypothetical protein